MKCERRPSKGKCTWKVGENRALPQGLEKLHKRARFRQQIHSRKSLVYDLDLCEIHRHLEEAEFCCHHRVTLVSPRLKILRVFNPYLSPEDLYRSSPLEDPQRSSISPSPEDLSRSSPLEDPQRSSISPSTEDLSRSSPLEDPQRFSISPLPENLSRSSPLEDYQRSSISPSPEDLSRSAPRKIFSGLPSLSLAERSTGSSGTAWTWTTERARRGREGRITLRRRKKRNPPLHWFKLGENQVLSRHYIGCLVTYTRPTDQRSYTTTH